MENSFAEIINSSKSVLILLPTNPYFDQVAAGLSLYLALKDKKEVSISSSSPMLVEFNRLIGVDKVSQDLGNKNLILKLLNYKPEGIERVTFDIDNDVAYLKVIPKPQIAPPKKDQIEISYSGVSSDLAILVGGGNETHFPALNTKDFLDIKLLHIGVRELRLPLGKNLMSFARPASSISEVVASLLKEGQFKIDADIATNLLMGIEDASKGFASQDVTADTFAQVAELMRAGGKRTPKAPEPPKRQAFPPGSIPGEKLPQPATQAPKSWLEPKIYKGTSIS